VPSGVQSPTGRPPLASPGQAPPPQRSASERTLQPGSATSTPGKAPAPAAVPGPAAAASKGMPIKGDRGRFKVYEVQTSADVLHPTMSCAAVMNVCMLNRVHREHQVWAIVYCTPDPYRLMRMR